MMKLKLSLSLSLLTFLGFAQNNNFENWSTTTLMQDSLDGWSSTNQAVKAITSTITTLFKSNDASAGSHAAHIQTAPFGFAATPVVGIMVNGKANLTFDAVTTKYVSGGGIPFGIKPPSLNGQYKINGSYPGLIQVLLTEYNTTLQQRDTIGFGSLQLSSANNIYTSFSVPINYQSTNTPDTLTIIVYASDPASVPGLNAAFSSLYLDEFWFLPSVISDLGIKSIASPTINAPVNLPDTVSAWIVNYGTLSQTGFDVSYTENGSNKVQESFTDTIQSGDSALFKFSSLWVPKKPGMDTLCVFVENVLNDGNSANDTACIYTSNTIGIEDFDATDFKVYPNPSQGEFTINSMRYTKANLYNSSGRLLKVMTLQTGENKVYFTDLNPGLYYLCSGNKSYQKISIVH